MWSNDQQRFLTAYGEHRAVAPAARQAAIHRSTVYRWKTDPAFVSAMDAAWEAGYQQWRREVYAPQEAARTAERERRRLERLPRMREIQAKAMEARRQKRGY